MRILTKSVLREYWEEHPQARNLLESWYREVRRAQWNTSMDVQAQFPTAKFLTGNRIIFRVQGNSYRIVASVFYEGKSVFVKFVGSHAEYDKIDANTVSVRSKT